MKLNEKLWLVVAITTRLFTACWSVYVTIQVAEAQCFITVLHNHKRR